MSYLEERWFKLLAGAVKATSKQAVGDRIGKSRTAISLVMSGKYPANTKRIAAKVLAVLDCWHCPYLGADINAGDCLSIYSGPTPSHDPARLAHRRVCRTCIHKHKVGGET